MLRALDVAPSRGSRPPLSARHARPSVRARDHFPTANLCTLVTRSSERSSSRLGRLRLFTCRLAGDLERVRSRVQGGADLTARAEDSDATPLDWVAGRSYERSAAMAAGEREIVRPLFASAAPACSRACQTGASATWSRGSAWLCSRPWFVPRRIAAQAFVAPPRELDPQLRLVVDRDHHQACCLQLLDLHQEVEPPFYWRGVLGCGFHGRQLPISPVAGCNRTLVLGLAAARQS